MQKFKMKFTTILLIFLLIVKRSESEDIKSDFESTTEFGKTTIDEKTTSLIDNTSSDDFTDESTTEITSTSELSTTTTTSDPDEGAKYKINKIRNLSKNVLQSLHLQFGLMQVFAFIIFFKCLHCKNQLTFDV